MVTVINTVLGISWGGLGGSLGEIDGLKKKHWKKKPSNEIKPTCSALLKPIKVWNCGKYAIHQLWNYKNNVHERTEISLWT